LIAATHATELPADVDFNFRHDRRSWAECWNVLWRWEQKRLHK
jgi:hypothetical protein